MLVVSLHQMTFAQTEATESERANLNTVYLSLTNAQVNPLENNQVIRAFVPTGSSSPKCLASLNDSNDATTGIVLFCAERQPFAFGNVPGTLVSVFFPQPVIPNLILSVTLYQQGAKRYGAPVLCTPNDGC
jgi:hypothetical protein